MSDCLYQYSVGMLPTTESPRKSVDAASLAARLSTNGCTDSYIRVMAGAFVFKFKFLCLSILYLVGNQHLNVNGIFSNQLT